jgi:GAF domain-containing protein
VLRDALAGVRGSAAHPGGERIFERISGELSKAGTLDEVATVVGPLAEALHADEVHISVYDHRDDSVVAVRGGRWQLDNERYPLRDYPATRHVMETRCSLQILMGDDYADPDEVELLEGLGFASMLLVPIVFRNRSLGIVEAYSRVERPWTRSEIMRARLACSHLGATIYALQVADGDTPTA